MRHIVIGDKKPPKEWLEEADKITKDLLLCSTKEERHDIIDKNQKVWGELKQYLKDLNYGKCWYSESREDFSYMHVDHFRPKKAAIGLDGKDYGGYWWLAFEWTNYRYCGSVGNVNKRDKFAVHGVKANKNDDPIDDELHYFLDPLKRRDTEMMTFDEEGKAKPLSIDANDWDYRRVHYTISNLKLNDDGVKEARRLVWLKCSNLIKEIAELLSDIQKIPSVAKQQKIEDKMLELKKCLERDAEFSSTAITCCIVSGYKWAIRLAA